MRIVQRRYGKRFTEKVITEDQVNNAAYNYNPSKGLKFASFTTRLDSKDDTTITVELTEQELLTMLEAVRRV